ncbi:hypothetical protein TVAG_371300 [Trichomonas vaginalis G3]|uniref:Uncharacterized protein n=1 Tax=Trichomonas vaginalis (strain ATCC PRA-98 / G3) TaxID=412133 RepID=A2FYF2_TRIV3|nr:protein kinase protein [Trichomonas vaginalis G3]EAX90069.1 hypothetical protein TVAG_371300 [Trichomonas vaginalis G3]KAI5515522.1 protein kinase protein [Trichomonas vaginalis G3]|eukprot:XP_001302999.1 hypothetical protein [Trichomonas vaginalis G3]
MSGKKGLDLEVLSDPTNPGFQKELKHSLHVVTPRTVKQFYGTVLELFKAGNLTKELGNEVLLSICKLVQDKQYITPFVSGKYIVDLPFGNNAYTDQLLDLLCFLVRGDPDALSPDIAPQFAKLVEQQPEKTLVLLAILAQKFDRIEDPWPIFEVLVKNPKPFNNENLFGNYVALLIYLNKNYEPFRQAYSKKTWRAFSSCLKDASSDIARTCLCGLCAVFDINPKVAQKAGYPTAEVAKFLKNQETKSAVIPLLLRAQPKDDPPEQLRPLIQNLVRVAATEKKATLILMEMATNPSVAEILVENPKWISEQLPTVIETVRLFAVVLAHKELRKSLMENPTYVIKLFLNMIDQEDSAICSIICTFTRRLPVTEDFVKRLGKSGFIRAYIDLFLKSDDPNVKLSGILFINTLSEAGYHEDYIKLIENMMPMLKDEQLKKTAAAVAATLAKHSKLHSVFREKKITKFFRNAVNDEELKKQAKKFNRNFEEAEQK